MKIKNLLLATSIAIGAVNATAYNIVDRAKITDDRFKNMEISRAIGHDFYINITGFVTSDLTDLMDDADKLGQVDTGTTDGDIAEVNTILEKYYDKEQVLRANVGLGFPLPSFEVYGTKIKPNFRVDAGLFAMLTPKKETVTLTSIIANLDQIPVEIRDSLTSCLGTLSDGQDILVQCVPSHITQAQADYVKDTYGIDSLPFSSTLYNTATDTPAIDIYAKGEVKAGFFADYTKDKHWFGTAGVYALGRVDIKKSADALMLIGGGGDLEFADNTLVNLVMDYHFGYKNSNYSVKAGVEEMKISELSKSDEGELNFGDDMLIRLHAQADYRPSFFKLSPYAGFHVRDGYSVGDGYYLGANWGMYAFNDRLGLNLKTEIDKEHLTLGLRTTIWFMHADLTAKTPITSEVDGVKVSGYYGANIRFFF